MLKYAKNMVFIFPTLNCLCSGNLSEIGFKSSGLIRLTEEILRVEPSAGFSCLPGIVLIRLIETGRLTDHEWHHSLNCI